MPNEIQRIDPNLNLPEHLRDKEVKGMDVMKTIIRPPMLKIIMKQSKDELLDKFGKGALICMPAEAEIAPNDVPFTFTPLFMWKEWCTWAPIEAKGQIPAILDSSLDPTSVLAGKASHTSTREEKIEYEGSMYDVKHVEHLNFMVVIHDHPLGGPETPMIMSFARAEYRTGSNLASLIQMRKTSPFNCVFEARVCKDPRGNDQGTWYGFDISNPSEDSGRTPWCSAEESALFEEMHDNLAEAHANKCLVTTHEEGEVEGDKPEERDDM